MKIIIDFFDIVDVTIIIRRHGKKQKETNMTNIAACLSMYNKQLTNILNEINSIDRQVKDMIERES